MRRLFMGLVVAATTAVLPLGAEAANQEVAERIAVNLREGGQLHDYQIGVKYQDGTAWVRGHVADREQLRRVLHVVSRTKGVRRVVNKLSIQPTSCPVEQSYLAPPDSSVQLATPDRLLAPESIPAAGYEPSRRHSSGGISQPAQRLQQLVDSKELRSLGDRVSRAQPLATSYVSAPARQVAASSDVYDAGRMIPRQTMGRSNRPVPVAYVDESSAMAGQMADGAVPAYGAPMGSGVAPARYDQPHMPNSAWPSYAAYPNYAAVTYPKQYSPTAWPYIGPFYPYPQVPLGWRKVTLEWDDGWWMLDFKD